MDAVEICGIDPRFDGQLTLRGGCAQGRVIGRDDVVVLTVEAQGEIRAGAKLHHAVDREVLRVVLQVVPIAGLDGAHVWTRDVHVVLFIGHARLIFAPLTVDVGRAVMPAKDAFFRGIVEAGPQMARDVSVVAPRFVQPRVFCFVVHRDEEAFEAASGLRCFRPRRGRKQVIGVVVRWIDLGVQHFDVQG